MTSRRRAQLTREMAVEAQQGTCGARTRSGGRCRLPAGHGTDHVGSGQCKRHGGSTPNGRKHAARIEARHLAVELEMEPHDALLWCVRVAAGEVRYFTAKIAELEESRLVVDHVVERDAWGGDNATSYVQKSTAADLHIWVRARQDAVDRLARYSKMALEAGVDERRVQLAERLGDQLGQLIRGIFEAVQPHLDAAGQRAFEQAARTQLVALEGGAAA